MHHNSQSCVFDIQTYKLQSLPHYVIRKYSSIPARAPRGSSLPGISVFRRGSHLEVVTSPISGSLGGGEGAVLRAGPQGPHDKGGSAWLGTDGRGPGRGPYVPLRLEEQKVQTRGAGRGRRPHWAWCPQGLAGSARMVSPARCSPNRAGAQCLMRKPARSPHAPREEERAVFEGCAWVSGWNLKAKA